MVLASLSVFAGSLGVDEAHKPEPIQTVVNDDALATDIHATRSATGDGSKLQTARRGRWAPALPRP